jgi:signal peptidase I
MPEVRLLSTIKNGGKAMGCKKHMLLAILPFLIYGCGSGHTYQVPTSAMEPTIKKGDSVVVDEPYYTNRSPERFDLVLIKPPDHLERRYVKRVVGLGGEDIQIKNNRVFINGQELSDPYNYSNVGLQTELSNMGPFHIPDGCYFLLGDNRDNSADSRYFGALPPSQICGKVIKINHR